MSVKTKVPDSCLHKRRVKQLPLAVFLVFCFLLQNNNAQNASYKGVDEKVMSKLGWKVAIQCWTYNQQTFFDALDSIRSLGVHYVEMLSYQTVSKDISQKSGPDMDKVCLEKVKAKLKETGISAVAIWVDPFPKGRRKYPQTIFMGE
jgi:hypothetical protein